jgi:hypothetical protein
MKISPCCMRRHEKGFWELCVLILQNEVQQFFNIKKVRKYKRLKLSGGQAYDRSND